MKPRVLVTREVFDETLAFLAQHCEVESNQEDRAFEPEAPYVYAMVQLDEGPRMISNLVECPVEEATVDMPVVAVFDDVTPEVTLVKFRPA